MRRALLGACLAFAGCAGVPPGEGFQSCDAVVAGDFDSRLAPSGLRREDLNEGVNGALNAATFTTDPRLNDQTENCRMLRGYTVYTKPGTWLSATSGWVAGETYCATKVIIVATPEKGGSWRGTSALVHELMHAMQGCEAPPPMDPGMTYGHENWLRDGIYNAIEMQRTK